MTGLQEYEEESQEDLAEKCSQHWTTVPENSLWYWLSARVALVVRELVKLSLQLPQRRDGLMSSGPKQPSADMTKVAPTALVSC